MKKACLAIGLAGCLGFSSYAQLTENDIAPDFTLTDINGTSHNLYSYLDSGYSVLIDVSATWCNPCWRGHQSDFMNQLEAEYGTNGTVSPGKIKVIFIEGDPSTTSSDLQGTGSNTQGDWVSNQNYIIIDDDAVNQYYKGGGYPTYTVIAPNRRVQLQALGYLGSNTTGMALTSYWTPYFEHVPRKVNGANAGVIHTATHVLNCINQKVVANLQAEIQNLGTYPVTSATITASVNDTVIAIRNWTGNLANTFDAAVIDFGSLPVGAIQYPDASGTIDVVYEVTMSGDNTASDDTLMKSMSSPAPMVYQLALDTAVCPGTQISVNLDPNYDSYLWNDGHTTTSRIIDEPGVYYVEQINDCRTYIDTFILSFHDTSANCRLALDTAICPGAQVSAAPDPGYDSYLWNDGSTSAIRVIDEPGVYYVEQVKDCRTYIDTFKLSFHDTSTVYRLAMDTVACPGEQVLVSLDPNYETYVWNDGRTEASRMIDAPGVYYVEQFNGCRTYIDTFVLDFYDFPEPVIINVDAFELATEASYEDYQWLFEGDAIPGATDSIYKVIVNGNYQVIVAESGCIDTSEIYEVTNTGIKNHAAIAAQIEVYPNPSDHIVHIRAPLPINVRLIDATGKIIRQAEGVTFMEVDDLATGVYFLQLRDKNGVLLKVEKLLKSNE